MTQFAIDFSTVTTDAEPTGWTKKFNTRSWVGKEVGEFGGKSLELTYGTLNKIAALAYDAAGSAESVEFLVKFTPNSSGSSIDICSGVIVRGGGDASGAEGYAFAVNPYDDRLYLLKMNGTSFTYLRTWSLDYDLEWDQAYWYRFKIYAFTLSFKLWKHGEPEPEEWLVSEEHYDWNPAGWLGLFTYDGYYDQYDWVGIGTHGDSARGPAYLTPQGVEVVCTGAQPVVSDSSDTKVYAGVGADIPTVGAQPTIVFDNSNVLRTPRPRTIPVTGGRPQVVGDPWRRPSVDKNWNAIRNAECLDPNMCHRWVACAAAKTSKWAVDDRGWLYSWGWHYEGQCGLGKPIDHPSYNYYLDGPFYTDLYEIHTPTLVDNNNNWTPLNAGNDYNAFALTDDGKLYGCGWGDDDGCAFGIPRTECDWHFHYESSDSWMQCFLFTLTRCCPELRFKHVAGNYAMFGIGMDDYLYVWGKALGLGVFSENIETLTSGEYGITSPIRHPRLTDKFKFLDADWYTAGGVTFENKIYVWGDMGFEGDPLYTYDISIDEDDPCYLIECKGLPEDREIVSFSCAWGGVAVVLDDGTLWIMGRYMESYGIPYNLLIDDDYTTSFMQVPFPEGTFIKWVKMGDFGIVYAGDSMYNLWGGGYADWDSGHAEPYEDISSLPPRDDIVTEPEYQDATMQMIGVEFDGQRYWIDADHDPYHWSHVGIDINGDLWCWGGNHFALLGLGEDLGEDDYWGSAIPQKCVPAISRDPADGDLRLNVDRGVGVSEFYQPERQGPEHDPCGHWHLRNFAAAEDWDWNCWFSALDVDEENEVFLVSAGKWWPFQLRFFKHKISENLWTTLYEEDNVTRSSSFGGHAEFKNGWGAYFNAVADTNGALNHWTTVLSNYNMGLWIYKDDTVTLKRFTTATYENGHYRMGLNADGMIAVAYRNTTDIVVEVSEDYGETFEVRLEVPYDATLQDYKIEVTGDRQILFTRMLNTDHKFRERFSDNAGYSWTSESTHTYYDQTSYGLNSDGSHIIYSVYDLDMLRLVYAGSFNGGDSWTYTDSTFGELDSNLIAVSGNGAVLITNEEVFYTPDYQYQSMVKADFPKSAIESVMSEGYGDLAANELGVYAYTAFNFYVVTDEGIQIVLLLSENGGANWYIRGAPLGYHDSWEEPNQCDPMFAPAEERKTWEAETWVVTWPKITRPKY